MIANSKLEIERVYRKRGAELGGGRYCEQRDRRGNDTNWSSGMKYLTRRLDNKASENVFFDQESHSVIIGPTRVFTGVEEPWNLGRVNEVFAAIAKVEGVRCLIDSTYDLDDPNHVCLVVQIA